MTTVSDDVDEPVSTAIVFEKLISTEVTVNGQDDTDGQRVEVAFHGDISGAAQTVHDEKSKQPSTSEKAPTNEEMAGETMESSSSETTTSETGESETLTTSGSGE